MRQFITTLLVILIPTLTFAENAPDDPGFQRIRLIEKLNETKSVSVTATSEKGRSALSGSATTFVVIRNFTIQPHSFKLFDQIPTDFSGADNLSVSFSLADNSAPITSMSIAVAYALFGETFVLTDFIDCRPLSDKFVGGARVPIYGPSALLGLTNDGAQPVTIKLLAVYASSR
jgi:hypothetical protein